jgi:hypothetical protein
MQPGSIGLVGYASQFQSSSNPKAGCNGVHLKPADTNNLNNDFRDPIIPHTFRQIDIIEKNSSNPDDT